MSLLTPTPPTPESFLILAVGADVSGLDSEIVKTARLYLTLVTLTDDNRIMKTGQGHRIKCKQRGCKATAKPNGFCNPCYNRWYFLNHVANDPEKLALYKSRAREGHKRRKSLMSDADREAARRAKHQWKRQRIKNMTKEERRARVYKQPSFMFRQSERQAKRRGIEFNLTRSQYLVAISFPCFYCKVKIDQLSGGLDRIDNSRGYVWDNIVPCCRSCNTLRGDAFTVEEARIAMWAVQLLRSTKEKP